MLNRLPQSLHVRLTEDLLSPPRVGCGGHGPGEVVVVQGDARAHRELERHRREARGLDPVEQMRRGVSGERDVDGLRGVECVGPRQLPVSSAGQTLLDRRMPQSGEPHMDVGVVDDDAFCAGEVGRLRHRAGDVRHRDVRADEHDLVWLDVRADPHDDVRVLLEGLG